jgi:thiol:disulfide interchange protein DsbC
MVFAILCVLAGAASAFGFGKGVEGCSGDCTACHKVSKGEVQDIFKGLDPSVVVEDVTPSPARGLYQVTLKKGSLVQVMYLDFSKNYLLSGQLIELKSRRDLTRQSVEAAATVDVSALPLKKALVMGNSRGKKVMYVFSDPECPYCTKLHTTLTELVKEEPDLKIYIFLVPLDIHPNSAWKTDSIMCTARENRSAALKMLEKSYQGKEVPRKSCGENYAAGNKALGAKLGVSVTPTIAFSNGKVLMGARSVQELVTMLKQAPETR